MCLGSDRSAITLTHPPKLSSRQSYQGKRYHCKSQRRQYQATPTGRCSARWLPVVNEFLKWFRVKPRRFPEARRFRIPPRLHGRLKPGGTFPTGHWPGPPHQYRIAASRGRNPTGLMPFYPREYICGVSDVMAVIGVQNIYKKCVAAQLPVALVLPFQVLRLVPVRPLLTIAIFAITVPATRPPLENRPPTVTAG